MSATETLRTIAERLGAETRVTNVFGDPIHTMDRTIIPVARISYAFAGGGGGVTERDTADGGIAGYVRAVPLGVIEISPAGPRFLSISQARKWAALVAVGIGIGLFSRSKRRR